MTASPFFHSCIISIMNAALIPERELREFCKRNHIRKLSLFGSILRDDFSSDSDVDILVEFDPDHVPGYAIIRMQDELKKIFKGREVDLLTPKSLHPLIRKNIEKLAIVDD